MYKQRLASLEQGVLALTHTQFLHLPLALHLQQTMSTQTPELGALSSEFAREHVREHEYCSKIESMNIYAREHEYYPRPRKGRFHVTS